MNTGKAPWLLFARLLWQGIAPMIPDTPIEGTAVPEAFAQARTSL